MTELNTLQFDISVVCAHHTFTNICIVVSKFVVCHIKQVEVKFAIMFLYVICVFITFDQGSFVLLALLRVFSAL